jgi:hypothetical protein
VFAGLETWLLGFSTAAATLILVGGVVAVSLSGLLAFHALVPHGLRTRHNDVAGFTFAPLGVIYAVLLAAVAVAVWEDFGRAEMLVQNEANLVGDLYRATVGLPEPPAEDLRHLLFDYAEIAVQDEWPALAEGRVQEAQGWQLLDKFHLTLVQLHPRDAGTGVVQAEMLRTLDDLYNARRGRYHAAVSGLPPILWWNLLAGGAIVILFSYLFGAPNFAMHAAMTAMLAASVALVLALIVLLDSPFRGDNRVSSEPFTQLVHAVETMAYPHD